MTFWLPLYEPRFLHVQYGGDHANWENCSEDTIKVPSAWIYTNTYPPLGGGLLPQIWWHKVYFPRAFWAGMLFQLVVMSGGIGVHSHASCYASVLPSSTIPFLPTLDSSPPLSQSLEKLYTGRRWPILSSPWSKSVTPQNRISWLKTPSLTQAQSSDLIFAVSWSCHLAVPSAPVHMSWQSPSFCVVWIVTEIR